ncbi:MAG: hypothetical protein LBD20_02610 [Spirochaetaceae bacterium]|jgi:hypothetical protein|nr:hypothetical protein [Spirochaetaceae bacterium]
MLKAIEIKNALSALLVQGADGFNVIGDDRRNVDAFDIREAPQVIVVFDSAQPDRTKSGTIAPIFCNDTAQVKIIACADANVDLSVLKNPEATDAERAAALSAQVSAEAKVTSLLDVVVGKVFDIITRPANRNFFGKNINLWITSIQYDQLPQAQGALCLKGAQVSVTYTAQEYPTDTESLGNLDVFNVKVKNPEVESAAAGVHINNGAEE